jgi:hypothetical protein
MLSEFRSQHSAFFTSQRFTLFPAYLYQKDKRALLETIIELNVLFPCNNNNNNNNNLILL